jgi:hypothetical protein
MKNPNIRKYLATAAAVFLYALLAKHAEKCLPYYFSKDSISKTTYPEGFVDLVRSWSFSNRSRFLFVPTLKRGEGQYISEISRIILSSCRLSEWGGDLGVLVHEVTHALKRTPHANPKGASYLEFMRDWLCEEIVAESSRYYGYDGSKILDKIFSPPIFLEYELIFLEYELTSQGIEKNSQKTLIEAAAYAVLSKHCFKSAGWITDYTAYYNQENNTDHSVSQIFEPPLLPPTLARAVKC